MIPLAVMLAALWLLWTALSFVVVREALLEENEVGGGADCGRRRKET